MVPISLGEGQQVQKEGGGIDIEPEIKDQGGGRVFTEVGLREVPQEGGGYLIY